MKKVISLILICIVFVLVNGCQEKKSQGIDGTYQSIGYGRMLTIEDNQFLLSDVTAYSCLPLMTGDVSDFEEHIYYSNDTITLREDINVYYFTRISNKLAICNSSSKEYAISKEKAEDPVQNFEALWDTFKEHYAYFDLRNVAPEEMYATYRPQITSETTQAELFMILSEMLDSFNDGHIGIEAPDEIEDAAEILYFEKHPEKKTIETVSNKKWRNHQVSKMVADHYIPNGTSKNNGLLRWGILENNIAYLQVNQMMGMANYTISDTLSGRDYWMAYFTLAEESENDNNDEVEGITSSLDQIMTYFKDTEALIIDVRFNGGGKDEVGMAVLQRFNSQEKVTFTKMGKYNDGYTPINEVIQPATETPYLKPVYLLISPESASATEIMALSAMSIPTVTSIGSRTEGVFSDMLDKELPNGWEFSLSNEVYLDLQGNNYEGIGIPPAIEINYPRPTQEFLKQVVSDLPNGDAAIQKAISLQK